MAPRSLSSKTLDSLRGLLNNACKADLPCASATVVSATSELFHHETVSRNGENNDTTIPKSTKGSLNLQDAPDSGRAFWLASCTKLITTIACMQLVEQGKLTLDDGDEIEGLCPELRDIKVLNSDGSTSEKNKKITLRMLLTHTAGFGYSFLNKKLEKYNYNEFSGLAQDFHQPLVNQPGERFEYGIGIDWAGIAVERVTQSRLGDYMQKHIFTPAGIKNLSLFPSKDMIDRLAGIWQRDANGRLSPRRYPLDRALAPDQGSDAFHSGGAGVWGTTQLLRVLLNNGTSPQTGEAILRPETVDMMFENQLPNDPNFARVELPAVNTELVHPAKELYPLCPASEPQGWGLGFMISGGLTGRSRQTVHWSGLSNCFWWCDREKGVAGIVASQVLPFADLKAVHLWADVETATYNDLAED
uniref:Beta-lactamase-related domain-containing protein n=1 Tax=Bionectria ochroleuca TaxID=29856 RepID=A0A8H7NQZ8_BIOOC